VPDGLLTVASSIIDKAMNQLGGAGFKTGIRRYLGQVALGLYPQA